MTELSRAARVLRVLQADGWRGTSQRVARRAVRRWGLAQPDPAIPDRDVVSSDGLALPVPDRRPERGSALTIGWVTTPPSLGSGGHTTMFRMVEALERAGHTCVLLLYDRFGGDVAAHEAVIRAGWPQVRAAVVADGAPWPDLDAAVATSWQTAHALAARGTAPMRRLYFAQDYEPYFYPRGSQYAIAEDTYRFGFRLVALGEMVAQTVRREVRVEPDVVPFGCDTTVYGYGAPERARSGIVFYTKPDVPRRGYLVARLALEEFHRRHPEQEIHTYGEHVRDLTVPVTWHGRLDPAELAALYRRSVAGLAMSFTNISLVAEEMLACGTVPVVNDTPDARLDLDNPHVGWASATPRGIADVLSALVEAAPAELERRAAAAAASVRQGWGPAQDGVVRIVGDEVYGSALSAIA
ncbi:rhamnosyltransferase WsaF family glycosyltransferase [Cellulomonas hominis]